MADDMDLNEWFSNKYLSPSASSEDAQAYQQALENGTLQSFREKAIEGERLRRQSYSNQRENNPDTQQVFTSDEWQQLINGQNSPFLSAIGRKSIDVAVLESMDKLPENYDKITDPNAQQEAINLAKAKLNAQERLDFNNRETEIKKQIVEFYPPQRLVDTATFLEDAEKSASDNGLKQQIIEARHLIEETMVRHTVRLANDETVVDQSNIADVYDGSMAMYEYLEKRYPDNEALKSNTEVCRTKLNNEIKIYDEENGFTDLSNKDAHQINETFLRVQAQIKDSKNLKCPPEEFAQVWDNIKFTDESDNPETNQNKRDELINSFNEAALQKAAMNVAVKHKGAKKEELDQLIQEELNKTYAVELGALLAANESARHLKEELQKQQQNPSYKPKPYSDKQMNDAAQRLLSQVKSGEPYTVDNACMTANFARYTNDNMGYLNRLGTKIGKATKAVGNMHKNVEKFDKSCIKRFDPYYSIAKRHLQTFTSVQNMGRQALNQCARYASSFIPGGNFIYGAYVGGQAAWRLATKYRRLKEEAKKNNRKFSSLQFLKDHTGEIASSVASTAAVMIGGGLAADALRYGAMGLSNITNFVKTFKRQKEQGNSIKKSFSAAALSVVLSTGTAFGSSALLGAGVHHFADDSHTEPVTDPDKIAELNKLGLDTDKLADQGYAFRFCDKDAEGAFIVDDGHSSFTTRDYTQEELDFAKHRMEKLFDENDSHTGGTRYSEHLGHDWTDKDYANNGDAYNNAIGSLDKLAESHPEMKSYIDGEFKSNSDMLFYKLYQANVLAPNADAPSDSGEPIGKVLSYTDENGNTTTYQDTYHKLLAGEALTEADAKVLQIVEDHVGGQHQDGVNDMGKLKDFDALGNGGNPDSYQAKADVGYELNEHPSDDPLYGRYVHQVKDEAEILPLVMVHDEQGRNKSLANRVGANAKEALARIENKKKESVVSTPEVSVDEMLKREYRMTHFKDPNAKENVQEYHQYCQQVLGELADKKVSPKALLTQRWEQMEQRMHSRYSGVHFLGKQRNTKEIIEDFNNCKGREHESIFCQELKDSLERSNKEKPVFERFDDATFYAGQMVNRTTFIRGTRDVSKLTDYDKELLSEENLSHFDKSSRLFCGKIDDFFDSQKTAQEYDEQLKEFNSPKNRTWRVKVGEVWGKLKSMAPSRKKDGAIVKREKIQQSAAISMGKHGGRV